MGLGRFFTALVLGFALAGSCLDLAQASNPILGTKHDFSSQTWSGGQVCIVCHTPHQANPSVDKAPLWNRAISTQTYTVYESATMNATVGQPDGVSKLCLSCHDGTIALDAFGGRPGTTLIPSTGKIGPDLSGDHPVSFVYDSALATADGNLYDPSITATPLGGTINNDLLSEGKVQCTSCHDVHNKYGNTSGLMKMSDTWGQLCVACHSF